MSNSSLIETLKSKPNGDTFVQNLSIIEKKADEILSKIAVTFPDYTLHNIKHSHNVIEKLDWLIPNSLKKELNEYEIYFIIASAYLHDIGMTNNDKETPNTIRANHHLRSERFIEKNFKDLAIEDMHQAKIIGRICRGHRKENLNDKQLFNPEIIYKSESINIPLLASFLRIADELDITFERTPIIIYEHFPPQDDISKIEWDKHLTVSGVTLLREDSSTIKCSASCKNPDIHRALKKLETKINRELDDLPNHLHHYRAYKKDLPRKFIMEIETNGYKEYDFKFSLQEKEIVNILMGEKLYSRKEESLRELLKNSVDGCRLKRELLKKNGMTYSPEIIFELIPKEDKIIVKDNGIGMDEDIIERYLTKVGKSFYRSTEFSEKNTDFTPVSELGIGILSLFMIANKIIIETKTDDSEALIIEIDDVSDYFLVKEGSMKNSGTTVTLFLKDNIQSEIELEKEIRYYARHLELPVKIILPYGKKHIIEDIGFKPDPSLFVPQYRSKDYGFHVIKLDNDYVDGIIAILLKKDDKIGLIPHAYRYYSGHKEMKDFVSNEGIFVGNTHILPKHLQSDNIYVDINLKKNVLDFNAARNAIVPNHKNTSFAKYIENTFLKDFENFLNTFEQKCNKANIDHKKLSNLFLSQHINISNYSPIKELTEKTRINKYLDLVKKYYYFKFISKDDIYYMRYEQITENSKPIYILENFNEYQEKQIKQVFSSCSGFSENDIYLLSNSYYDETFVKILFKGDHSSCFTDFIKMEKSDELGKMIPISWKLMKFKNYRTDRLIEFTHGYPQITILNRDNRFINLIIKGKHLLKREQEMAIEGFFRT